MPSDLLRRLADLDISNAERAVVLLWWYAEQEPDRVLSSGEIARALEDAGYAKQNPTRLGKALSADPRTTKRAGGFRLKAGSDSALRGRFGGLLGPRIPAASGSVLPDGLFEGTRGYIEHVVHQLNAAYDVGLFDCSAVMARRLVETLIIELYEHRKDAAKIKGADGHFMMLAGLLGVLENDPSITLGRNALSELRDFKKLGDLSAHNRRFNARQSDIDRVRDGLRVASEELLVLAGFRV